MGKLEWYGPQARNWVRTGMTARLRRAALVVANHAKILLNTEGTAQGGGRDGKGRFRKKLRYNAHPSEPGEAPHKQTGRLLASVAWEVVGLAARVGTNLDYGRWLELGTARMKARPWLRRALKEKQAEVQAILAQPLDGPT